MRLPETIEGIGLIGHVWIHLHIWNNYIRLETFSEECSTSFIYQQISALRALETHRSGKLMSKC